jgi:hypothetical protein
VSGPASHASRARLRVASTWETRSFRCDGTKRQLELDLAHMVQRERDLGVEIQREPEAIAAKSWT